MDWWLGENKQIRGLVQKFGSDCVWFAFLEEFGYPVTWSPSGAELNRLIRKLEVLRS